jgi:glycosyltransferase involved in cell wall biosynthesis
MKKVLINGSFLCRRLTGIERFAYEITLKLDKISKPGEIAVIVPNNTENIPEFTNLEIIRHRRNIKSHLYWQMVTLQWFLITHRQYIVLEFGNTALPFALGIVFLHDIYCEFFPEDFTDFRNNFFRLYYRWQYRLIAKRALKLITVSFFSRGQIAENFNVNPEKIAVIYNSWEHFKSIQSDNSVFDAFPVLREGNFYFMLGNLSKRKNIKWIVDYAAKHPGDMFVISGVEMPATNTKSKVPMPKNIFFTGYLDDRKTKALMIKCKALIMPSYYEGFGIPPLEALSCGAQIIISNTASLPEIYGNTAHYIDPFDTNVDLDEILKQPVEPPGEILKKYSYDTSARQVYSIIQETVN